MNNNGTSATNDSMNIDAYFESLILDAVEQADAPLHEALVRSSVYRTINESYERALAQLVIDGELLYANGEYSMAPDAANEVAGPAEEPVAVVAFEPEAVGDEAVEPDAEPEDAEIEAAETETADDTVVDDESVEAEDVAPEAVEPEVIEVADESVDSEHVQSEADEVAEIESVDVDVPEPMDAQPEAAEPVTVEALAPASEACGPISLRADSTLEQLRTNENSWPIPVAAGVSYDKKPANGLSLMGYELPAGSVEAEQQEPVQPERPELALSSEPQQLAISFLDGIEAAKAVAEPEAALQSKSEPEQPALELESPEDTGDKLECPEYLSGWDDPRSVFASETQVAFLDKQNIHDVFGLVRELGKAEDANVRAAFEKQLCAHALPLSPQYRAQVTELGKLSGNARLVFDVFGNLRSIGLDCRAFANIKGPITETLSTVYTSDGAPLSLWNLAISPAIQRKLKWNLKIYDLPELLTYSASKLRSGGLAPGEVHSIVDALKDWPAGSLQLARIKYEMELARQAAIGGWYPSVNTPVERAIAVNRLADEAVLQL